MNTLAVIVSVVGGLFVIATALIGLWVIPLYRKLSAIQGAIRAKNDEIDAIEPDINGRTSGTMTVEKQRVAMAKKAKEPLLRQLERLEQERQFIIDKLPFFK